MISYGAAGLAPRRHAPAALAAARLGGWQLVFLPTFLLYLVAGWYLTMVLGVVDGDAVSRTAQASAVVAGRDPHLAAIGFVWNPLPSLVQIPLVWLLRPFGLHLFAGPIQSALCMAATAVLLWRFAALYDLRGATRAIFVGLFVANPLILLYASNGMSEAMFILCLVGMAYYFARWARTGRHLSLVGMALLAAVAFGVRYEALALAAAGFVAIMALLPGTHGRDRGRIEATLLIYATPFVYAVALWIFFNWTIQGDPFFFWRSIYSNDAQSAAYLGTDGALSGAAGSPLGTLRFAATRLFAAFLAFGIVLAWTAVASLRRGRAILGLGAITLAVPAFHACLLYGGSSFGWLRFFMYGIPGAFVLAPPLFAEVRRVGLRRLAIGAMLVAFAASGVVGLWAMADPRLGRQEHYYLGKIADPQASLPNSWSFAEDRAVAAYLEGQADEGLILLDSVRGFAIWLHAEHPERFAISSDRDFAALVARPVGQVEYILVPSPTVGRGDLINARYPELYEGGLPWATPVRDFGGESGWRLFRVVAPGQ